MDTTKEAVAFRLANAHYTIDPSIQAIIRILAPGREEVESEPIKLLEVNRETAMNGIVPVHFGAHSASGIFFPSIIVEVRPEEFEKIRNGEMVLPNGWTLGETFSPPLARASA